MNFSKLNDLTLPELNITEQVTDDDLINTIVVGANDTSGGYLGLAIMTVLFLTLTIINFKQDGDIRLGIMRSMFIASGFSTILGVVLLVSGLTTSLQHVIWYLTLTGVLFFIVRDTKKKGL